MSYFSLAFGTAWSDKGSTKRTEVGMVEFFISTLRGGYQLLADGLDLGTFDTKEAAADFAVRFAQNHDAPAYRLFY